MPTFVGSVSTVLRVSEYRHAEIPPSAERVYISEICLKVGAQIKKTLRILCRIWFLLYNYSHCVVTLSFGLRLLSDNQLENERGRGNIDLGKQIMLTF